MNAHLLIVDDDERIRSLLKQFLLRNGFLVSAARDACLIFLQQLHPGPLQID